MVNLEYWGGGGGDNDLFCVSIKLDLSNLLLPSDYHILFSLRIPFNILVSLHSLQDLSPFRLWSA